jgi:hypothetical protein
MKFSSMKRLLAFVLMFLIQGVAMAGPTRALQASDITDPSTQFFDSSNGHIYELAYGALVNWQTAYTQASQHTLAGVSGYLVTITSADENAFIYSILKPTGVAYYNIPNGDPSAFSGEIFIGASDNEQEGVWKWVSGPEAGTQFWSGLGYGGVSVGGLYSNWFPPYLDNLGGSDGNANWAEIMAPGCDALRAAEACGKWGDVPVDQLGYYLVEYSGPVNVPAPATAALLGLGLVGISTARRKRA